MVGAKEEVLAFTAFPSEHWRQIWSTNPLERLNKELKRRCRVVGIFPNESSVIRGAVLLDMHDDWVAAGDILTQVRQPQSFGHVLGESARVSCRLVCL